MIHPPLNYTSPSRLPKLLQVVPSSCTKKFHLAATTKFRRISCQQPAKKIPPSSNATFSFAAMQLLKEINCSGLTVFVFFLLHDIGMCNVRPRSGTLLKLNFFTIQLVLAHLSLCSGLDHISTNFVHCSSVIHFKGDVVLT